MNILRTIRSNVPGIVMGALIFISLCLLVYTVVRDNSNGHTTPSSNLVVAQRDDEPEHACEPESACAEWDTIVTMSSVRDVMKPLPPALRTALYGPGEGVPPPFQAAGGNCTCNLRPGQCPDVCLMHMCPGSCAPFLLDYFKNYSMRCQCIGSHCTGNCSEAPL